MFASRFCSKMVRHTKVDFTFLHREIQLCVCGNKSFYKSKVSKINFEIRFVKTKIGF